MPTQYQLRLFLYLFTFAKKKMSDVLYAPAVCNVHTYQSVDLIIVYIKP